MPESETDADHDLPLLLSYKRTSHELNVRERFVHELVKRHLLEKVYLAPRLPKITRESVKKLAKAK